MTVSTTGTQPDKVQLRENPAKEKTLRRGDYIALLGRRLPSHRDAGRLRQCAASPFLLGLSLEHLPNRVSVDMTTGAAKRFMAKGQDPDAAGVGASRSRRC
jgi:hypothetical protein